MKALAYWTLFACTLVLYGTILGWSLPQVSAAAGELLPFDLRPGGYDFDAARAFLAALTPDGAAFYSGVQHQLDLFYPPLMSLTLFFAVAALTPARLGGWKWLLAAPALVIAACDLMENACVDLMLDAGATGLTPEIVATASGWTVAKSTLSTVVMCLLLALLAVKGWAALRRLLEWNRAGRPA